MLIYSLPFLFLFKYLSSVECVSVHFPEDPPQNATLNIVKDNFLGVSYELSSFDTLWGKTTDAVPGAIQNYMRNLNMRTTNPLRIRVGGNAMDGSTYVANMTDQMLNLTDPDAYFNDQPADFGPVLFDVMNTMAEKAGEMQFIIGLSMRDPADDSNVVELAQAAENKLGARLDAMLLGNEPDLYAGHGNRDAYNITAYIPEVAKIMQDLRNQNLLDNPILGGPTVCCDWSLDDVLTAGLKDDGYKYYTLQHYPYSICSGANAQNTNISYYLSHTNVNTFGSFNQDGISLAKSMDVPVLLTELNSVSCGGSNVSNTFAATLWLIDAGLQSAAQNFTAVYIHTREYGVTYNLFDPPSSNDSLAPDWRTGSTYYAALFLSEVISSLGNVVADLNVNSSISSPEATVAAYGLWANTSGSPRDRLVLLNFGTNTTATTQSFDIPATSTPIQYRLLIAPSVWETSNITWAGQTITQNGTLNGTQETLTLECSGGCTIEVPGPGAALVLFGDQSALYEDPETASAESKQTSSGSRVIAATFVVPAVIGAGAMLGLQI